MGRNEEFQSGYIRGSGLEGLKKSIANMPGSDGDFLRSAVASLGTKGPLHPIDAEAIQRAHRGIDSLSQAGLEPHITKSDREYPRGIRVKIGDTGVVAATPVDSGGWNVQALDLQRVEDEDLNIPEFHADISDEEIGNTMKEIHSRILEAGKRKQYDWKWNL